MIFLPEIDPCAMRIEVLNKTFLAHGISMSVIILRQRRKNQELARMDIGLRSIIYNPWCIRQTQKTRWIADGTNMSWSNSPSDKTQHGSNLICRTGGTPKSAWFRGRILIDYRPPAKISAAFGGKNKRDWYKNAPPVIRTAHSVSTPIPPADRRRQEL